MIKKLKIPRKKIIIYGAVTLVVLLLWFLFSARAVTIIPEPAYGDVGLSGGLVIPLGGARYLVRPGNYRVAVTAPGHQPLATELQVSEDYDQKITLRLEKLPGRITLRTQPDVEAQVSLADGRSLGSSKEEILVPAGPQQLHVKARRYRLATVELEVEGMHKRQHLTVALQPAWGDVSFTSEPSGAEIWQGQQQLGTTPFADSLEEGEYQLTLRKAGYKDTPLTLSVVAGQSLELEPLSLPLEDGKLVLSTSPVDGASVTVDGQYRGTTPLTLSLSADQEHVIQLFKSGYQNRQQTLRLSAGETRELPVQLNPVLGQVKISAKPGKVRLWIDGRAKGTLDLSTPRTFKLPAKATRFRLEAPGYAPFEKTLTPGTTAVAVLNARLLSEQEARWARIPKQNNTPTGQPMRLFRPADTFTLGSSRREPGRRANEVQRKVTLKRPFYLAIHEVRNQDYRRFKAGHDSGSVRGNTLNEAQQPVVNITWEEAALFCNWLSKQQGLPPFYTVSAGKISGQRPDSEGYRLPTEAEWAWAARLKDQRLLRFSWGDKLPPPNNHSNIADRSAGQLAPQILASYSDGYAASAPVGSFPANHRGLHDLDGNVAEWVHDFYAVALNLSSKIPVDPLGPEKGQFHVIRGPGWLAGTNTRLRLSYRDYSDKKRDDLGFRVARYVNVD